MNDRLLLVGGEKAVSVYERKKWEIEMDIAAKQALTMPQKALGELFSIGYLISNMQ